VGANKIPTHWNASGVADGDMPTFDYRYNSTMTDLAKCRKQFYEAESTCDPTGTGVTTGCAVDIDNTYICEGGCPQYGNCCSTYSLETACTSAGCQWTPSTIDLKFDLAVTSFGLQFPLMDDPGVNGGECRSYTSSNADLMASCNSTFYGDRAGCEANEACLWSSPAELSTLSSCAKTKVQASLQMQSTAVAKVYDVEERLSITVTSTYVACTKGECVQDAAGYCHPVNDTPSLNCNQKLNQVDCETGDAAQQCAWKTAPAEGFGPGRSCDNTPAELAQSNKGFARLKTTVNIDILNTGTDHTLVVARDLTMKGGSGANYESILRTDNPRTDSSENCYGRIFTPGITDTGGSSFVYSSIKLGNEYYTRTTFEIYSSCFSVYDDDNELTDNTFAFCKSAPLSSNVFDFKALLTKCNNMPRLINGELTAASFSGASCDTGGGSGVGATDRAANIQLDLLFVAPVPDIMHKRMQRVEIAAELYPDNCGVNCADTNSFSSTMSMIAGVRANNLDSLPSSSFEMSLYHVVQTPVQPSTTGTTACANKLAVDVVLNNPMSADDSATAAALIPFTAGALSQSTADGTPFMYTVCTAGSFVGTCSGSGSCSTYSAASSTDTAGGKANCEAVAGCTWTTDEKTWLCFSQESEAFRKDVGEPMYSLWDMYCQKDARAFDANTGAGNMCPAAETGEQAGNIAKCANNPYTVLPQFGSDSDGLCQPKCALSPTGDDPKTFNPPLNAADHHVIVSYGSFSPVASSSGWDVCMGQAGKHLHSAHDSCTQINRECNFTSLPTNLYQAGSANVGIKHSLQTMKTGQFVLDFVTLINVST